MFFYGNQYFFVDNIAGGGKFTIFIVSVINYTNHLMEFEMKKYWIIISAVFLTTPNISLAGKYGDQVKIQLGLVKLAVTSDGWEETHDDKIDKMDDGEEDSFSFTLKKGMEYKIISVCDADCSDIDLVLYDENDKKISSDFKDDGLPIVEVAPKWTGEFTLKVKMFSCKTNPCYYGISIIGK